MNLIKPFCFLLLSACLLANATAQTPPPLPSQVEQVFPGVWKLRFGTPDRFVPSAFRFEEPKGDAIAALPKAKPPFDPAAIRCRAIGGRCVVYVPLEKGSEIYGFGLGANAFCQRGMRKTLQVSAAPVGKTGYSHAPVPYYVSTAGYAVWIDTARVSTVHVGRLARRPAAVNEVATKTAGKNEPKTTVESLYAARKVASSEVVFDIPNTQGVDVYLFAGPTIREAVQRYNLFSGGGAMPPLWGLGMKYRTHTRFTAEDVLSIAKELREKQVPCDVLGLEPGWHTHAYSCSFVWSDKRYPDHEAFLKRLFNMDYRVNLWEHAYIHPTSPMYKTLLPLSGDYEVWGGIVPDFTLEEAERVFADYHDRNLIQKGISGFKGDECDKQPIEDVTPFNFPFCATFPSGIDGERYAQLFGTLYQRTLYRLFRKHDLRTWGDIRAGGSLAAPSPFNLYSDAYDQAQYLRQQLNAGMAGLLWSPEVRQAGSVEELASRVGMTVYAPQMCLNMWFLEKPPWKMGYKWKDETVAKGRPAPEFVLETCRKLAERRMALVPYLYATFAEYHENGMPPCRALVLDWPEDRQTWKIDDAYMLGNALLVAPLLGGASERWVYLPEGKWYAISTGECYEGKRKYLVTAEPGDVPVFVKDNTILPLARPVQSVQEDTVFELTAHVYGNAPRPCTLVADDGTSYAFERGEKKRITLSWNSKTQTGSVSSQGKWKGERYKVVAWNKVKMKPAEASCAKENLVGRLADNVPKGLKRIGHGTWKPSSIHGADTEGDRGHLLDDAPVTRYAFHTNNGRGEHVTIVLEKPEPLRCIHILNRLNASSDSNVESRAKTLAVSVSEDGRAWTKVWRASRARPEWIVRFDKPIAARFVKVELEGKDYLHLRKVWVFRE